MKWRSLVRIYFPTSSETTPQTLTPTIKSSLAREKGHVQAIYLLLKLII
jgi:hypothetical protein